MKRRLYLSLAAWVALYAALLALSQMLVARGLTGASLVVVALLPMLAAAGVVDNAMRRYRAMDELQKRMQSESIVFSFACTALVTFSYGFLENAAHAPMLSYFWVWLTMGAFWVVGKVVAWRRFR